MYYTIGEIAKKLNLTTYTLRYYDKEGLLPFVERDGNGIRRSKDSDLEWLSIIECLKQTGMPLKDIRVFIDWSIQGDDTIAQRLELIRCQREAVQQQIEQLHQTLKTLDYKCWYYEKAKEAGTCEIHRQLTAKDVPDEFHDVFCRLHHLSPDDAQGKQSKAG